MNIREIQKEDNPFIAAIIRTAIAEFKADPHTTILGDPVLNKMFESFQYNRAVYYVILENEERIGGCGIKQLDGGEETICELQRMFLLPSAQGKGYGKALMDLCLYKARAFGYKQIYLETLSDMKKAISLYEINGFNIIKNPLGNTGHSGCNVYMVMDL